MATDAPLAMESLILPGHHLSPISQNIHSVLGPEQRTDTYDRIARTYDWVVGNSLYNRIMWGTWASTYADAAREAVAAMENGPMLDCGCGSLVFTAETYGTARTDRMVLFDRSLGMMQRGARRLPQGRFIQGDAFEMPFRDSVFSTIVAWGFLHVVGTGSPLLAELRRVAIPGAAVMLSTLVLTNRGLGNHMLGLLHRNGEAALPETESRVVEAFSRVFHLESQTLRGSMLMLRGRA